VLCFIAFRNAGRYILSECHLQSLLYDNLLNAGYLTTNSDHKQARFLQKEAKSDMWKAQTRPL